MVWGSDRQIGYDRPNMHVRQKSWPVAINGATLLPTTKHRPKKKSHPTHCRGELKKTEIHTTGLKVPSLNTQWELHCTSCLFDVSKKQEFSLDVSYLAALQQYSLAVTALSGPWNQQVCWDESSPVYCQGPVCESLHRLTYLERISKKKLHQKFEVARGKSWQRGPASATVIALCSWENISCLHFLVEFVSD